MSKLQQGELQAGSQATIIKPKDVRAVTIQMSQHEYDMMKLALKYYGNHYTLELLKKLEKEEYK